MLNNFQHNNDFDMYTAQFLEGVKRRAIRRRVWFKALDCLERSIISLSARVLDEADKRSSLGIELAKIIVKVEEALRGVFEIKLLSYGYAKANANTAIAIYLGSNNAEKWINNDHYAKYLTFIHINSPTGWISQNVG